VTTEDALHHCEHALKRAAEHTGVVLKRLGYAAPDCEQEAVIAVLALGADRLSKITPALAYTVARRHLLSLARKKTRPEAPEGTTVCERAEARCPGFTVELLDLLAGPSPRSEVGLYLRHRVLDGLTWDETRDAMGLSNDALARVRHEAASWVMFQLEG